MQNQHEQYRAASADYIAKLTRAGVLVAATTAFFIQPLMSFADPLRTAMFGGSGTVLILFFYLHSSDMLTVDLPPWLGRATVVCGSLCYIAAVMCAQANKAALDGRCASSCRTPDRTT